jgi:uncharacterized protein YktB (UPF0637 family)
MSIMEPATFEGFVPADFDVFKIDGLEQRMNAIINNVRPKLGVLGDRLTPYLSALCGEEMFAHVAKHARRTINPPEDTWVAYANNKRGYKSHPHFQIGLFSSHVFIQFAVIYESGNKSVFAAKALDRLEEIRGIVPSNFIWSGDHTVPEASIHGAMDQDELKALFERLQTVKASEILCGIHIAREDPLLLNGEALIDKVEETFETLMPLYRMAF